MTKKPIYRITVTNMRCDILYMSDLLYFSKDLALRAVKECYCKKEENISTHKWESVFVAGVESWRTFEKVRNDSNERYIGIITETLILE